MASWQAGDCAPRQRVAGAPGMAYISSSMVSDCYSSDEDDCTDFCKDTMLNWSFDRRVSSVMNLPDRVAAQSDQRGDGGYSVLWNKFLRDPSHTGTCDIDYVSRPGDSSHTSAYDLGCFNNPRVDAHTDALNTGKQHSHTGACNIECASRPCDNAHTGACNIECVSRPHDNAHTGACDIGCVNVPRNNAHTDASDIDYVSCPPDNAHTGACNIDYVSRPHDNAHTGASRNYMHTSKCDMGCVNVAHNNAHTEASDIDYASRPGDSSHTGACGIDYASRSRAPSLVSATNDVCEFYRPPSEMRTRFNETLAVVENASTVAHYYSEPRAATRSSMEYVGIASSADELVGPDRHFRNASDFLFPSSSLLQESLASPTGGPLLGLFGGGALASRPQSDFAVGKELLLLSENEMYSPDFVHSVSCRVPALAPLVKSASAQFSSRRLLEQAVQTSRNSLCQRAPPLALQDAAASPVWCGAGSALGREPSASQLGQLGQLDQKQQRERGGLYRRLLEALDTIESHVEAICREGDHWAGRDDLEDDRERARPVASDSGSAYPSRLVQELRRRVKDVHRQLECRLGSERAPEKPRRRQRHHSEVPGRQRDRLFATGDYPRRSDEPEPDLVPAKEKGLLPRSLSRTELLPAGELRDFACRLFELSPYDDLVRSFQSSTDRRIKAVGNKMKCAISMEGPLRIFDSTSSCWNMRNKLAYRCSISGATKEAVDKCLKCLQDTFPQSYLNERHFSCRPDKKPVLS